MPHRTYFTKANTSDLDRGDLIIMNRAARLIAGDREPTWNELSLIRFHYKFSMSARDLCNIIEQDLGSKHDEP